MSGGVQAVRVAIRALVLRQMDVVRSTVEAGAEIEVILLRRQCLGKRRIGDLTTLQHEVRAWNRRLNCDGTTIEWNFTRKQAQRKLHYSIIRTRH